MKSKATIIMQILMLVFLGAAIAAAPGRADQDNPVSLSENPQPALSDSGTQQLLRVYEGKSFVLHSGENFKRVAVTNDQVASAMVVAPNQVLIHGIKPGNVSLLLWNEQEEVQAFDLQVQPAPLDLEPLRATLGKMIADQNINVSQSGSSIVLTGVVPTQEIAERAVAIAKTAGANVVNLITVPTPNQVVMLEVKFAEVQRTAIRELGANIFSTGALNTPGTISTQQYSPPNITDVSSSIGTKLQGFTTELEFRDMLNIFVFRPDLNLGLMIKALQQRNLLETLAEPNLLALAGKEASFLAGGEFPVPIVQGTTGGTPTVTVQFKEYGIRLKFVANPNPDGTINLHLAPEVSALDFANAVTLSGFLVPALMTRRAETDLQLKDGQSFAIAGLLDNRVTKLDSKIPWLGDVPILGKLFRSQNFTKAKTELLVMVTPRIVRPLEPGQTPPMPDFPVPFLDQERSGEKPSPNPATRKSAG